MQDMEDPEFWEFERRAQRTIEQAKTITVIAAFFIAVAVAVALIYLGGQ